MVVKIKYRIGLIIKQLFYYCGLVVERIPDETELVHLHEEVRMYKLKKLANTIREIKDHNLYNSLLKKYIANWDERFVSSEFIGDGSGEYNLGVYRKVRIQNNYYFEKVYFNDSPDLLKVEWFYEHIYPISKDLLKTVKLYKIIKGDLISLVYFEYIELAPLSEGAFHPDFLDISKNMIKISTRNVELINNAPDFFKQYRLFYHYVNKSIIAEEAIKKLSNNRLTMKKIEQFIDLQPLVITHGDIYYTNVLVDNYIIDWDSFGLFPHGLEVAFIFATNIEHLTFKKLQTLLNEKYKDIISEDQWDGFELSCWYFYLIFTARQATRTASYMTWQKDAYHIIEKLYDKIMSENRCLNLLVNCKSTEINDY